MSTTIDHTSCEDQQAEGDAAGTVSSLEGFSWNSLTTSRVDEAARMKPT